MARLKRGAKSQAIRDQLAANPDAAPKEVIAALAARKMKVTSQMVSTIKMKMNGNGRKRGRRRKNAVGRKNGAMLSLDTLVQAKKLAEQLGGIEKAKEAMDALAKLQ